MDEHLVVDPDRRPIGRIAMAMLAQVPVFLSSVVSLAGVAYVTGWMQARAYFGSFGAGWLLPAVPASALIQFSWLPLLYLAQFIWLGIQDLEITENTQKQRRRWRAATLMLKWGLLPAWLLVFLPHLISSEMVAAVLLILGWILCFLVAGAAFETLIILARGRSLSWDTGDIGLVVVIAMFGLYAGPTALGSLSGRRDASPKSSGLPHVLLDRAQPEDSRRLLLVSGDTAFLVKLTAKRGAAEVAAVPLSTVDAIVGHRRASPAVPANQAAPADRKAPLSGR